MKLSKKNWLDIPVIALLAANTIPLFGVLFLDWDAFFIVLLYWAENLVIGFYNILKIAFAAGPQPSDHLKLFLIPFFTIHYGGFTAIHGVLVSAIFNKSGGRFMEGTNWPSEMKIAVLALFISHGVSFVYNYLLKREFASASPIILMFSPYARVVVMHIAIIAGGFLVMTIGSPAALLLVLVVLKTFLDLTLHLCGHKKATAKTTS